MKKILFSALTLVMLLTLVPNEVNASPQITRTETPADSSSTKAALLNRLNEIKTLDRSSMTRPEKNVADQEANTIRKTLHDNYGGIYVSFGALLLIIILLIIFL